MTVKSTPPPLQQCDRRHLLLEGRKLLYFAGCNYYRMSDRPEVVAAAEKALRRQGLNVAASRLTTGNHRLYEELEAELAGFFGAESALLVNNGYNASMVVAQALAGQFSQVLVDARAHPALQDASRFFDAPVVTFAHRSGAALAEALARCGKDARVVVLTDGMFSHDGSVAPLKEYRRLLSRDSWLLVDDSHGAGVLGRTGQGTLEQTGISRQRVIQTITLSKALGSHGGAILGNASLRRRVINSSRMFAGQTPVALPLAAAALAALQVLRREPEIRNRLHENSRRLKEMLGRNDLLGAEFPGPIIPIIPSTPTEAERTRSALLRAGIFPPLIRYPGCPAAGYFRFVVSSEHRASDLQKLANALR